jgi:hypothetical protein
VILPAAWGCTAGRASESGTELKPRPDNDYSKQSHDRTIVIASTHRAPTACSTPVALPLIAVNFAMMSSGHLHLGQRLIARIRDYVQHWNTDAKPFTWTATAEEILAKVRWIQTNIKQLVNNNAK